MVTVKYNKIAHGCHSSNVSKNVMKGALRCIII